MAPKRQLLLLLVAAGCGRTGELCRPAEPASSSAVLDWGVGVKLSSAPPNVMLVVDRSGSMSVPIAPGSPTTKWTDLKTSLRQLVTSYDASIRLGITIYSSDGDCGAGSLTAMAPGNGAAVLEKLDAQGPAGRTPTAPALALVIKQGMLDDPRRANYVVLATDGLPNCGDVDVKGKIEALYAAKPSVKTFVIGVGEGTDANPALLNAWAAAGHTERAGAIRYYQTNSQLEIKAAFDAIAGGIVSPCRFKMTSPAPEGAHLYVWSAGVEVPADPENGYTYDPAGPTVTLHGAACDRLIANEQSEIEVVSGCASRPGS